MFESGESERFLANLEQKQAVARLAIGYTVAESEFYSSCKWKEGV